MLKDSKHLVHETGGMSSWLASLLPQVLCWERCNPGASICLYTGYTTCPCEAVAAELTYYACNHMFTDVLTRLATTAQKCGQQVPGYCPHYVGVRWEAC